MITSLIVVILIMCITLSSLSIELFFLKRQLLVEKESRKPIYGCFNGLMVFASDLVPKGQIWINPEEIPEHRIK